jgi:putative phosphoesterase
VQIGLLSDTHGFLDPAIFQYFAECDEIWHAGDFGPVQIFDDLKAFKPLRGVYGNIDGAEVRACTTLDLHFECEGLSVYITHIGGYPGHYEKHARAEILEQHPGLFICGHSHILKVMRDPELNLIHLNPGAAGHTGWHITRTLLRFHIDDAHVHKLEAIELGPRGRMAAANS